MVGAVLGSYRITAELARGGMGTVYRAEHELLGRTAAVKLLLPELTASQVLVERFFNEAKAATAIRHPGIVEVYDFGYTDDGYAYLVMEFLEGVTLGRALTERGRYNELEAASIARGIASALKAAHGKNIIHRDLKPDNVFLVPDPDGPTGERVKVLDFGIAKLVDNPSEVRHTQTGMLMGSPMYMAPEQARAAGAIDHRADLYSLGCILYELLVGTPPFVAEGAGEIIALQMFGQVEPPSTRLAEITPEMERIVMRLLEKEPHDRYQSAAEVVSALAAVGAKLSTRLSAPTAASESRPQLMQITSAGRSAVISGFSLASEAPQPPPTRSAMPIIAGVLTFALAGAAAIFVITRDSHDTTPDQPSPASGPSPGLATTATTPTPPSIPPVAAPPVTTTPPSPPPTVAIPAIKPPRSKPAIKPNISGPVTSPGKQGPVTTPKGPATSNGSPIYDSLDDDKPKKKVP